MTSKFDVPVSNDSLIALLYWQDGWQ